MLDWQLSRMRERQVLAEFLRSRRARVRPEAVGFPSGSRRRAPGLRREEVAQLAGISVTWYTWLEQGRDIRVSDLVLENIARVLQLDAEERRYLFTLADRQPIVAPAAEPILPPTLQTILDHQGEFPAYILGKYWEILAWNQAAANLFGDFAAMPEPHRNLLWMMFASPAMRDLIINWGPRARHLLAEFRADVSLYLTDARIVEFVSDLQRLSAEFAAWWPVQDVISKSGGKREFNHPRVGYLMLEQTTFRLSGAADIKLILHVPTAESAASLHLLATTSEQGHK